MPEEGGGEEEEEEEDGWKRERRGRERDGLGWVLFCSVGWTGTHNIPQLTVRIVELFLKVFGLIPS